MGKKNKKMIVFTILLFTIIVVVATIIKVYTNHVDNLYKVVEKKIAETTIACFQDEICTGKKTTLGFLIKNGYLKSQVNPITKEYISEDLVIKYKDGKCKFNIR